MICKRLQIILACLYLMPTMVFSEPNKSQDNGSETMLSKTAKAGKEIVFSRNKGNCISCHIIDGADAPGNIGPPLVHIQKRFSDKQMLRSQIWDSIIRNPESSMPPFGRHKILTENEIDMVAEFIWTL